MIEIRHPMMTTSEDTKHAYDELYHSGEIALSDSYYLWILDLLKPQPNKVLIDISCGRGRLVTLATQKLIRAIGVDFSSQAIILGKSMDPNSGWVVSDGEQLGIKSDSADYITHIGNLEHYQNPDAGIQEICRILKPDGIACILLPNGFSLLGNIKHVAKTGDVFDDGQPLQRYNTRIGWENLLRTNGLKIVRTHRYEHYIPKTQKDWIKHIKKPSRILRFLFAWLVPFNLSNCFVYICCKDSEHNCS